MGNGKPISDNGLDHRILSPLQAFGKDIGRFQRLAAHVKSVHNVPIIHTNGVFYEQKNHRNFNRRLAHPLSLTFPAFAGDKPKEDAEARRGLMKTLADFW